ncbi:LPS export ABC transporter permease LptF [Jeongeupia sp. HS-3]|uniref:LPS export ABC transporter permease LptF n=1 Tax=Jeongeupia sp. HS-3 TaxID=1009682 RepID=UPI0018A36DC0|nr:LPS export ABC transporter permease LptF [Jeongeupia sp. HS-3]
MLFRRSLIHEMSWVAIAVFSVLLLVVMTTQVVKLLGQATLGVLGSGAVWVLMGFTSLRYLPMLMSLMLFIAILSTMTRLWKDNEMVIWFASGRSIKSFIRPVLEFAIPIVLLIAALSLFAWPWAQRESRDFREKSAQRQEVSQVAPGVFRESAAADRIYFVEHFVADTGRGKNVFAQLRGKNGKLTVVVANEGGLFLDQHGERWLWLGKGHAYTGVPGTAAYETTEFERAQLKVETHDKPVSSPSTQAKSTMELLGSSSPEEQGELAWRIALPISALIMAMCAIPFAFFNPRGGRALNLLGAVFVYFLYYNFINIGQAWIADGKIPVMVGMWPIHGAALAMMFLLYRWRGHAR